MGYKKKKNVIILSFCMVVCFILYQLYFFLTITSVADKPNTMQVLDLTSIKDLVLTKSEDDKFINENGIIRGVHYSNIKKYRPNDKNEFKCISSDQYISVSQINDDYCDCNDGTDEPSTSACPNGVFYCDLQLKKKNIIFSVPSSKVNDGICDCCDGSDEWLHEHNKTLLSQSTKQHFRYIVTKCPNNCI